MKKAKFAKFMAIVAAVTLVSITVLESTSHARAGGSRSVGSRGSRSYSKPASPYTQSAPSRPQYTPSPAPFQQPARGSFLRSMAGGIVGGMLGGMLFRSLGMAGGGMGGMGGGIGLFEILLLAGIGYLIYRYVKNRREQQTPVLVRSEPYRDSRSSSVSEAYVVAQAEYSPTETGISHIRQMDPSFDEGRFKDSVMDMFFKIQGAWMNRDLPAMSGLLTDEMRREFQDEVDRMLRNRQVNRLENIAVRNVEVAEAWQESGQDYITTLIYANLLDYTTDDATGAVVSGSKTEPVKFEEFWTFTRAVGSNGWRLSAIEQK